MSTLSRQVPDMGIVVEPHGRIVGERFLQPAKLPGEIGPTNWQLSGTQSGNQPYEDGDSYLKHPVPCTCGELAAQVDLVALAVDRIVPHRTYALDGALEPT